MILDWIVPLIAALAMLVLGVVVGSRAASPTVRSAFIVLSAALVSWNVNFVILYGVTNYDAAWFLTRLTRNGSMVLPAAILHLTLSIVGKPTALWRRVLLVDYGYSAFLCVLNNFDLVITHLATNPWGYYTVGGRLYHLFTLSVMANLALAIVVLRHAYVTAEDARVRHQLRLWLLGFAFAVPLGLTNFLPTFGVPIYPMGSLGIVIWVAIVAYGILRHRLMDVQVAVTKGIAYSGVALMIIGPAFAITLAMQRFAFGDIHYDFSAVMFLVLVVVAIAFPWVRARAEEGVERSLFRQHYDMRQHLDRFAQRVVQILDQDALMRELCTTLIHVFEAEATVLFVGPAGGKALALAHCEGRRSKLDWLPYPPPELRNVLTRREALLRAELAELGESAAQLAATMADNQWEVCLPVVSEGLLGILAIGQRRGLRTFTASDLELLSVVGTQASIALENSRLYEELRKSQELIQRAGRLSAIGTLAAGIAHEIRNPLVSIQTFFQLVPGRIHDEEFLTSFLQLTEAEVKRICDLITELLNFSKSATRTIHDMDLAVEVDRVLTLLIPQARQKQVNLQFEERAQNLTIQADADQVRQVVINLILNALEAVGEEGNIKVWVDRVDRSDGQFCVIAVADDGPGIPEDLQHDIFNPFFTTKSRGTGLGLAICNQIVAEHGGFIGVESHVGKGSEFRIHLPASSIQGVRAAAGR